MQAMTHGPQDRPQTINLVGAAIEKRRVVEVTYNGARLRLWPHQLFTRGEGLHLSALNPEKSRRLDDPPTLGKFNALGLREVVMTPDSFVPLPHFDPRKESGAIVSVSG